eukprot:SAG31_NODE_10038_length_1192_cov_1.674291_1_plen_105_part_00
MVAHLRDHHEEAERAQLLAEAEAAIIENRSFAKVIRQLCAENRALSSRLQVPRGHIFSLSSPSNSSVFCEQKLENSRVLGIEDLSVRQLFETMQRERAIPERSP